MVSGRFIRTIQVAVIAALLANSPYAFGGSDEDGRPKIIIKPVEIEPAKSPDVELRLKKYMKKPWKSSGSGCCKYCSRKACGDNCINFTDSCSEPKGCACVGGYR